MNLNLTPEQTKKLLDYIYIAYNIIASNKQIRDEDIQPDIDFVNFIYKNAYEQGYAFIKKHKKEYYPEPELEKELIEELEEYEDDATFNNLTEWLAERDLFLNYDEKQIKKMSDKQYLKLLEEFENFYTQEFAQNGIKNLFLLDNDEQNE